MVKLLEILIAIVMVGIVIAVHEFGHFLVAKLNGVTVTEFALGMGPKLISKKYKGTVYCIKLLPFGGSCQMLGEGEDSDEQGSFSTKNVWQRISIVFAGPFFNFILAFLFSLIIIFAIGYDEPFVFDVSPEMEASTGLKNGDVITSYQGHRIRVGRDLSMYELLDGIDARDITITYLRDGKEYKVTYAPEHIAKYYIGISYSVDNAAPGKGPMVISKVVAGGAAEKAGMQENDVIIAINDAVVSDVDSFTAYTDAHPFSDQAVRIKVRRGEQELDLTMTPHFSESYGLGFTYNDVYRSRTGFVKSIGHGFGEVGYWIKSVVKSLAYMLKGKATREDIGGPVRVVSEMSNVMETSYRNDGLFYAFLNLINWAILLSANLGVMNLLPIPALDGGRLLIYIIEVIRGKKMKPEHEAIINFVGFALLMLLMVFILFNDLSIVFK
ncbi:MAG: RIP metalloprotease RseP [Lachnospiraceae bacterium]|nr:RIP metalloprotease RseP [Lachnospiraceae bacterium]